MDRATEERPAGVPETATQAGEIASRWGWVEPSVWTARMLAALEEGVRGGKWYSLMDKVYAMANLRAAFEKVRANGGAAGVDHQTVEMYERRLEENLERLSQALKAGMYRPQAVRRVWIPKMGSKEKRPLGIPTVQDRWCKQRYCTCWSRSLSGILPSRVTDSDRIQRGGSFDLDFHTVPFHGEDALVEKHYVSKRSRRQKGILAFLAQDAGTHVFCYANAQLRKDEQNDEILRFAEFWKQRTGQYPVELIFDSRLTTYSNLNRLNQKHIDFITLRRRSVKMLREIAQEPVSAWRRIELEGVSRAYRTPRILDRKTSLQGYQGPIRQLTITDLGHEEPTLLLTNQMQRSPAKLIGRYAQRMIIENNIADGIDFFHMDALSSAVAMKVDCDLQLTLMASSLYRLLGSRIRNGYQTARSRTIFRDFVDAVALVTLTPNEIAIRFQKRAHNPLLIGAGFTENVVEIPWLEHKRLRLSFG
jgi:hypothetical protein